MHEPLFDLTYQTVDVGYAVKVRDKFAEIKLLWWLTFPPCEDIGNAGVLGDFGKAGISSESTVLDT